MINISDVPGNDDVVRIINSNYCYYEAINFASFMYALGLKRDMSLEGDWSEQENGILVKPMITDELCDAQNLTYLGLIFKEPTNAHYYKTQEDTILFKTLGKVDFGYPGSQENLQTYYFYPGNAIQIPSGVIRQLSPVIGMLEIELIIQPKFKDSDEIPADYMATY
jgi:hypothetical protein